jgi:hypothetical protein
MNHQVFLIALAVGTVIAVLLSWRYSRKGIHPRFYPHIGFVIVVFLALMGIVSFLSFMISTMIGNEVPSVRDVTPVSGTTEEMQPKPQEK